MKNLANEYALFAILQPWIIKHLHDLKRHFDEYDFSHDESCGIANFEGALFPQNEYLIIDFENSISLDNLSKFRDDKIAEILVYFHSPKHEENLFRAELRLLDYLTLGFVIDEQTYTCINLKKGDVIPIEKFDTLLDALKEIRKFYGFVTKKE